ncbi:uncharacterized protein LY89DRAFT_72402 [Mollisia scopiformis]|uniref:Secreted protein n=1 Tax=Mollisia scopiformis TaxID=149040 RepID=A0A194XAC6_MOLSC|nr:uncharacterized protein LY89DRAFT_72402 [Mollisia scopiformis]KUJ17116.1 hypothetical protein LY89DRAFT_72402 [Mollisia scopiformis]
MFAKILSAIIPLFSVFCFLSQASNLRSFRDHSSATVRKQSLSSSIYGTSLKHHPKCKPQLGNGSDSRNEIQPHYLPQVLA